MPGTAAQAVLARQAQHNQTDRMMRHKGQCHCGNLQCELELTRSAKCYEPRACDCAFCLAHGAAFVSDPDGELNISVRDATALSRYRHGTGQAEFLVCARCGVFLAVCLHQDDGLRATVNARALADFGAFGGPVSASPQRLAAGDRLTRWRELWFSNVKLVICG